MSARIMIGGDLVPTESNSEYFERGDVEYLIGRELFEKLNQADYTIFNLEVPLTDKKEPIAKCGPNLIAPENTINGLRKINKGFFTLANNHILDQGMQGLFSTMKLLEENHIDYAGVGRSLSEASRGFIKNINGINLGIYCCAEHEFSIATENKAGANPFDPLESLEHIETLKQKSDYVIVLYHGGKEHYRYPSPYLQKVCRKMADKGADLVICQHSHCIGCEEIWNGKTIIYGQGNFLFDHSESEYWKTSLLIELQIDKTSSNVLYHPLKKCGSTVRLAPNIEAEEIMKLFKQRSSEAEDADIICEKYEKFSGEYIKGYLCHCVGIRQRLLLRIWNKLLRNKFYDFYLSKIFKKEELFSLRNIVECEAHRELFIAGINRRIYFGKRDNE